MFPNSNLCMCPKKQKLKIFPPRWYVPLHHKWPERSQHCQAPPPPLPPRPPPRPSSSQRLNAQCHNSWMIWIISWSYYYPILDIHMSPILKNLKSTEICKGTTFWSDAIWHSSTHLMYAYVTKSFHMCVWSLEPSFKSLPTCWNWTSSSSPSTTIISFISFSSA